MPLTPSTPSRFDLEHWQPNHTCLVQDLITKHKALCAEFLERNYDRFFERYQNLLLSENYVVRRQSLKLLVELLLDRHNFNVMQRYISNPDNLKLLMNMLKEKSRNIQFEAFHVFKVSFLVNAQSFFNSTSVFKEELPIIVCCH